MKVEVYAAHTHVMEKDIRGKVCVVIDTLRATSTIVTALANGCEQVIPVEEVDQAMEMRNTMSASQTILGGERNAQKMPGFDFGNSPFEYTEQNVHGKTLIMTTTNGTQAIAKARDAVAVYLGAMINGATVAAQLVKQDTDAVILCAGTRGKFSLDDCLTAGYILYRMHHFGGRVDLETDDLGRVCEELYTQHKDDLQNAMKNATHYNVLLDLGMKDDLDYCFERDIVQVLPRCVDGRITLE